MKSGDLSSPRQQAPLGVVVMFLLNMKKWGQVLVFGLLPFIREREEALPFWMFWVFAAVVLILVALFSFLQWKNFSFYIEADKFVIRKGVFRKEESLIPLERIQTVHIKRNIIQQILSLAALQLDTAGSAKKEAEIPALKYEYATELKSLLLALKEEGSEAEPEGAVDNVEVVDAPEKVLMKLGIIDLFKVGLTENHVRSALILFGVFFGYGTQYSEFFGYDEDSLYDTVFQFILVVLPIFIVVFIIVSVFWSMWRTFLRYFDLTVSLQKNGLSVKSGLLKREENFVPVNKIQYIKWQSNPLRKLIGYQSLAIYQAASAEVKGKKAVRIPGCKTEQRHTVTDTFYPEYKAEESYSEVKPAAYWQMRLLFILIVLPLLLLPVLYFAEEFELLAIYPIYVLAAIFFIRKYVRNFEARLSDDLLVINRGYVFPEQVLLKLYKVQNVEVVQSIFQKKRGLVSLKIYTASGVLKIPFIAEESGFAIANKFLFTVEISRKNWM